VTHSDKDTGMIPKKKKKVCIFFIFSLTDTDGKRNLSFVRGIYNM